MGPSQQEVVKFQDKVFSKFQDISRSQNAENHYVLRTTNQSQTSTRSHYNYQCNVIQETMIVTVSNENKAYNWIHIWSKQISNAASKTLNCHWARTTMVNIRTFVLNDWDFRTISNFTAISGQLCNFRKIRNFRTTRSPAILLPHYYCGLVRAVSCRHSLM